MFFRLLLSTALLLPSMLFAQQNSSAATTQTPNARGLTIRGCIAGSERGYHFTQQSNGAVFDLLGDASQFQSNRGKLVEVKADELPPTDKGQNPDRPKLKISNLQVIADTCPPRTTGESASSPHPPSTPASNSTQPTTAATPRYAPNGAPDQTPPTAGINPNSIGGATGAPSPGTGNRTDTTANPQSSTSPR